MRKLIKKIQLWLDPAVWEIQRYDDWYRARVMVNGRSFTSIETPHAENVLHMLVDHDCDYQAVRQELINFGENPMSLDSRYRDLMAQMEKSNG